MPEKNEKYKRLPGRGTAPFGVIIADRQTLWLGKDHLLLLGNRGYAEAYKRFKYKNIQALVVTKTVAGMLHNITLGILALIPALLLLLGIQHNWDVVGLAVLAIITGMFAFFLIVSYLLGPTCKVFIYTSVQTERLYSLHRMATAMKVVGTLKPLIEEQQGTLTEEHMSNDGSAYEMRTRNLKTSLGETVSELEAKVLKSYDCFGHKVLFSLLLADMCISCIMYFNNGMALLLISTMIAFATIGFLILSLAKQVKTDLSDGLKILTWSTVAYFTVGTMLASIHQVVAAQQSAGGNNTWEYLRYVSSIDYSESVFGVIVLGYSILCSGIIGFTGLVMLNGYLKDRGLLSVEQELEDDGQQSTAQ